MRTRRLASGGVGGFAWTALLAATLSIVTACATVVPGSPLIAGGGARVADPSLLDVGDYPTKPRPPLGTAGTSSAGAMIEAQRMANYVVGPWEVDPTLKSKYSVGALVLDSPDALTSIGPAELATVSGRHDFINGFVSARQASGEKSLVNAVLRFADPPSATAAVADLAQTTVSEPTNPASAQRTSIPGYPDALATSYTVIDPKTKREWIALRSFAFHGPYVLTQLAQSVAGLDSAARLVANTITLQSLVIDQFPATNPAEFAEIEVDPSGLLARTLPMPADQATTVQNARFGKRGALHFQDDAVRSAALFDRAVMDLAAMGKTNVYRSSDIDAAVRIVDEFAAIAKTAGSSAAGVEFMPASRCVHLDVGFYCVAPADRWVIEVQSRSLDDAHQQVAAQYILLMGE